MKLIEAGGEVRRELIVVWEGFERLVDVGRRVCVVVDCCSRNVLSSRVVCVCVVFLGEGEFLVKDVPGSRGGGPVK